jgi:hypothetical protein
MPGLNLHGAARASAAVSTGNAGTNSGTVTDAAFGPGATTGPGGGSLSSLHPATGQGLAFWGGVLAIGVLVFIRSTLPR